MKKIRKTRPIVVTPRSLARKLVIRKQVRSIEEHRNVFSRIINSTDPRLLIVAGPCSIHDPDEALEYARLLAELRRRVADKIELCMRVYFEKPRTTLGWKGLIMQPGIYESSTLGFEEGIFVAGKILIDIAEFRLPVMTEWLDPVVAAFLSWGVTSGTIGARTTQSPLHRFMASGLPMPVGFKNGICGSTLDAVNALQCARGEHVFLGINEYGQLSTITADGNPDGYVILRGGASGPNFDAEKVAATALILQTRKLPEAILIDCSHGNSLKDFRQQGVVFHSVINQRVGGQRAIKGLMLESNLNEGSQSVVESKPLQHGVSITDSCIGWEETVELVMSAYEKL